MIFVQGPGLGHQLGNRRILAGDVRVDVRELHIGPVQHGFGVDGVPHRGDISRDGAIAERDHIARIAADDMGEFFMLDVGDRALHEGDVHVPRKFLDVRDGRKHQFHLLCEVDQPFIEIEKGHMAAGASAEPHCCDFGFHVLVVPDYSSSVSVLIHSPLRRAVTIYLRNPVCFSISAMDSPFLKSAPVGQTSTHLPHEVQLSDDPQG